MGTKIVGGKPKKRTPYWTAELKEAVTEKMLAFRMCMNTNNAEAYDEYRKKRNYVKTLKRKCKQDSWIKLGEELEKDTNENKNLLYGLAKSYRKPQNNLARNVKDEGGSLLDDDKMIQHRWKSYFEALLNVNVDPENEDTTEMIKTNISAEESDEEDITLEEVQKAIYDMKNNKSSGYDELPSEVYKNGGEGIQVWLHEIIKTVWSTGEIPDDWRKAIICPVYKKGDKQECGNYRGISLLSHASKVYERILERRLRTCVEDKLGEWQHGFRPYRSTTDLIFCMKMIIEKKWEFNEKAYFAFLDLEKAFDRVPRRKLFEILALDVYGVPQRLQRAIRGMYSMPISAVRSEIGVGEWFEVHTGVRQGSVLSPLLFILLMDQVLKMTSSKLEQNGNDDAFAYADDAGLLAGSIASLQNMIDDWCGALEEHGLKLNVEKSEVMHAKLKKVSIYTPMEPDYSRSTSLSILV